MSQADDVIVGTMIKLTTTNLGPNNRAIYVAAEHIVSCTQQLHGTGTLLCVLGQEQPFEVAESVRTVLDRRRIALRLA